MKNIFIKKQRNNSLCKCGNLLPENYKYKKCPICRRESANQKKAIIGLGSLATFAFTAWLNKRRKY